MAANLKELNSNTDLLNALIGQVENFDADEEKEIEENKKPIKAKTKENKKESIVTDPATIPANKNKEEKKTPVKKPKVKMPEKNKTSPENKKENKSSEYKPNINESYLKPLNEDEELVKGEAKNTETVISDIEKSDMLISGSLKDEVEALINKERKEKKASPIANLKLPGKDVSGILNTRLSKSPSLMEMQVAIRLKGALEGKVTDYDYLGKKACVKSFFKDGIYREMAFGKMDSEELEGKIFLNQEFECKLPPDDKERKYCAKCWENILEQFKTPINSMKTMMR